MRIIIMGTGPFAVPTAERLLQLGHDIPLVVTRPLPSPAPKKTPPRPVFDWATKAGIELFEPASANDEATIANLASYNADLFFVCDYGQILSNDCLGATRLGGINLHGSILPRHRGAAPVQWALLRGDEEAGVTVIHMTARLDAGPALVIAKTEVVADETAEDLEPRLAQIGVEATNEALRMLEGADQTGQLGEIQDQALVTRAPRFHKSHGQLDCRHSAEYLVRLIRACQPWPSTFGQLVWTSGKSLRIQVRSARWCQEIDELSELEVGGAAAVRTDAIAGHSPLDWSSPWDHVLAIRCGSGYLLASRIQPAGKRVMDASEFLRGHPVNSDASLTLPEVPIKALA